MKAWLNALRNWFKPAQQPTRVGLLDSGELVIVDSRGGVLLINAATTQAIGRTLAANETSQWAGR